MFSTTSGKIDDRWQRFMKFQIARTRGYFADAEGGIDNLDADARWPVWSALILYRCGVPLTCINALDIACPRLTTLLVRVPGNVAHLSPKSAEYYCRGVCCMLL